MSPPLRFGQIVWAEITDANGISKARPVVIVTPDERIAAATLLDVVAITSQIPDRLPEDHVLLPWHAQGHPRTGLNRKCAAVCGWIAQISMTDIQSVADVVPGPILLEIASKIASVQPASDGNGEKKS